MILALLDSVWFTWRRRFCELVALVRGDEGHVWRPDVTMPTHCSFCGAPKRQRAVYVED